MADLEKVLRGWERCAVCDMTSIINKAGIEAYRECEYTIGLYCGRDKLIRETIEALKEYRELKEAMKQDMKNGGL